MKLRNKKTGEIGKLHCDMNVSPAKYGVFEDTEIRGHYWEYNSLAELNEEWEDYEEPKEFWYIGQDGIIFSDVDTITLDYADRLASIGNYFETKEEAEKAVEKLKAWKLLKDECNIKFDGIIRDDKAMLKGVNLIYDRHTVTFDRMQECMDALHLLFGGE